MLGGVAGNGSSSSDLWSAFGDMHVNFRIEVMIRFEIKQLWIRGDKLLQSRKRLLDKTRKIYSGDLEALLQI